MYAGAVIAILSAISSRVAIIVSAAAASCPTASQDGSNLRRRRLAKSGNPPAAHGRIMPTWFAASLPRLIVSAIAAMLAVSG